MHALPRLNAPGVHSFRCNLSHLALTPRSVFDASHLTSARSLAESYFYVRSFPGMRFTGRPARTMTSAELHCATSDKEGNSSHTLSARVQ